MPQQAWIQNATVKDNILFGKELDQARYNRTIEVCALKTDFEILPAGDMTEIGEKARNSVHVILVTCVHAMIGTCTWNHMYM